MTKRAVGLKINRPEIVAAISASAEKIKIPARFTFGPPSESYRSSITLS
jgi:hypothetical protein